MSQFPETDRINTALNLGVPPEKFVLGGGSAVEVVVGPGVRRAGDTDIAVDDDTYRQLRERHDLEEKVEFDGYRHLTGNGYDVSIGWGGRTTEELQQRGYVHNGVHIVGLHDVYEHKQNRDLPKDGRDLEIIRNRLYKGGMLPKAIVDTEMAFIKSITPEHLHGRPELEVAANGLVIVRTVFGHEDEGVRTYGGSVETGAVPATYHAWNHSGLGAKEGQEHIDIANDKAAAQGRPPVYTDDERLAALAGYTNHDAILGGGRRAVNPEGHDEKRSAELVAKHLEEVSASEEVIEGGYATAIATTFNERIKGQDIDPSRGHVKEQQLGAGQDMARFRKEGVETAVSLVPEDLAREAHHYGGALQHLIRELNESRAAGTPPIRIRTIEDGLRLIDENPDYPVTKAGNPPKRMTLREAAADHLRGSGGFYGFYAFQGGWEAGSADIQAENAAKILDLAAKVEAGEISLVEAYRAAFSEPARQARAAASDAAGRSTSSESAATDPGHATSIRESVAGGDSSIERLRITLETAIQQLPQAELAAVQPRLDQALSVISNTFEQSQNTHVQNAKEQIEEARTLLEQLRQAMQGGADELRTYLNGL